MSKKKLSKVIILGDSAYLVAYSESAKRPSSTRTPAPTQLRRSEISTILQGHRRGRFHGEGGRSRREGHQPRGTPARSQIWDTAGQ